MNFQFRQPVARPIPRNVSSIFNRPMGSASRYQEPLTEDQLRAVAPSIFAVTKHSSRSDRFTPVPTIDIVRELAKAGFVPMSARQSRTRDAIGDRADYTKHLIRFRSRDTAIQRSIGDTHAEVALVNANDGTSSYQLSGGLFRLICLNGMTVSDGTIEAVRIGHTGNIIDRVIDGTFRVMEQTGRAIEVRNSWGAINLAPREAQLFAEQAHALRFNTDGDNTDAHAIPAHRLLDARRYDDNKPDLWHVFNRVQENATKGGIIGHTRAGYRTDPETGREVYRPSRRVSTREIKGIDQDVKLNKALWALAEGMAKLKEAA